MFSSPQPSHIRPQEYEWVFEHYGELVNKYPNEWIAFQSGKVIAHGDDPVLVHQRAKDLLKVEEVPTFFVEKGIHVYLF